MRVKGPGEAGPLLSSGLANEDARHGRTGSMRRVPRWVTVTATVVVVAVIIALGALAIGSVQ